MHRPDHLFVLILCYLTRNIWQGVPKSGQEEEDLGDFINFCTLGKSVARKKFGVMAQQTAGKTDVSWEESVDVPSEQVTLSAFGKGADTFTKFAHDSRVRAHEIVAKLWQSIGSSTVTLSCNFASSI